MRRFFIDILTVSTYSIRPSIDGGLDFLFIYHISQDGTPHMIRSVPSL